MQVRSTYYYYYYYYYFVAVIIAATATTTSIIDIIITPRSWYSGSTTTTRTVIQAAFITSTTTTTTTTTTTRNPIVTTFGGVRRRSSYSRRYSIIQQQQLQQQQRNDFMMMLSNTNHNEQSSNHHHQHHHRVPNHVCIIGSGIIGTSTAYYLAKLQSHNNNNNNNNTIQQQQITLIDRTGHIAPAASGKAGGFLAYDWNDNTPTEQLTHRSYQLHETLAQQFGAESIQYRTLSCISMNIINNNSSSNNNNKSKRSSSRKLQNVEWINNNLVQGNVQVLGTKTTIAQVHPKLLCERLWHETKLLMPSGCCQLVQGTVVETLFTNGTVSGVQLENGTIINADAVLYTCGSWNILNSYTTGNIQTSIMGVKYHSLIVPTKQVYDQCVFFHGLGDPEVYVRPNQTAYCTGYPDPPCIVTEYPGQESIDSTKITTILNTMKQITTASNEEDHIVSKHGFVLDNKNNMIQQACYLPSTTDGVPIMGELYQKGRGLYIATGHSCWGILLGPGTGECMAHLIATGNTTTTSTSNVDLDPFDPYRFK